MGYALVVRHAQSTWNAEGRWQGQADPPLSEAGLAQVEEAAARLAGWEPFEMYVTSDLVRARRTAEILARRAGRDEALLVEPGLREYDVAAWSGLTREQISARWPDELERYLAGSLPAPPGGEPRDAFDRRVAAATARVAAAALEASATRIVVVAHGGVIRALARVHGVEEYRLGPLAGYEADLRDDSVVPLRPVDLFGSERTTSTPGDADPLAV